MLNEDPLGVAHLVPSAVTSPTPAASSAADPAAATASRPWQGTTDHSAATALLREMAGEAGPSRATATPSAPATPAAPAVPAQPAPPAPADPPAAGLHRPVGSGGAADTAALLRELSSLGDEGPAKSTSPGPRPSGRPAGGTPPANSKRRKGLWGRG